MKTLVIGDIHGMFQELKALLSQVGPVDEIISCGDIIDRGPDSYETIKFCQENNIKVCLGNHELMAIEAIENYLDPSVTSFKRLGLTSSDWFANGGNKVFPQFENNLPEILEYLKSLPLFYLTSHTKNDLPIIVSHSLITRTTSDFSKPLFYDSPLAISAVWNRQFPMSSKYFNIHGHTPTDFFNSSNQPFQSNYHLNLDTGCCYDSDSRGKLTGILLPDFKIYQQDRI